MLKRVVRSLAPAIDILSWPAALVTGPVAAVVARMGEHAPRSRALFDRLGVSLVRHHYYQPVVRAADLPRPLAEERELPGLDLNEAAQLALVAQFHWKAELEAFPEQDQGNGYHYRNGSFESGDAEFLYGMIRHFKPRRLVEIGSGYSTLMAQAAITAEAASDPRYACDHVCIEPYEMPWLETLPVRVIRERVELLDASLFRQLEAGDILFIDSSHVIRPQGDVLHEYLYLLPQLAPGVIVHIHDVFTPRDYLADWVLNRRWMWNEQYLLEAFLSFNREFEVLAAVNWLSHNHAEKLEEAAPVLRRQANREPGSFWIRRTA